MPNKDDWILQGYEKLASRFETTINVYRKEGKGPKVEGMDIEMENWKQVALESTNILGGPQALFMDSWQLQNERKLIRDAMYDRYTDIRADMGLVLNDDS